MSNPKKENRKAYLQFGILLLTGGVLGGLGGFFAGRMEKSTQQIMADAERMTKAAAPILLIVLAAIGILYGIYIAISTQKAFTRWDKEDEEEAERMENKNFDAQTIISVNVLASLVLSGICLSSIHPADQNYDNGRVTVMVAVFFFGAHAIFSTWVLNRLVGIMKNMNPEKRGNVFSWNFNKDWINSCDEQEKGRMYEASYKTYIHSQIVMGVLYILCMLLSLTVDIGILPFLILGIIWLFQAVDYYRGYRKIR